MHPVYSSTTTRRLAAQLSEAAGAATRHVSEVAVSPCARMETPASTITVQNTVGRADRQQEQGDEEPARDVVRISPERQRLEMAR